MNKKLLLLVALISTLITGCGNPKVEEVVDDRISVSEEEKVSYEDIANEAVEALGDVTDDIKNETKKKAVYDAILEKEGRELMMTISITREEAINEINKNLRPKIYKVIEMDVECEDENHKHENEGLDHNVYYVYEGDTSFDGVDLKTVFPTATNIEYRDATYEDNVEEMKRSLASEELVKLIDSKVEKVLS